MCGPCRCRLPEEFLYKEAAELFKKPMVSEAKDMKVWAAAFAAARMRLRCSVLCCLQLVWKDADEKGIMQFLVTEKGFNAERVSPVTIPRAAGCWNVRLSGRVCK